MAEFEGKGLRELQAAMNKLSGDMANKIARQATAAGARIVRDDARRRAPKLTGALRKGIVMKREKNTQLTEEFYVTISTREMKKYVEKSRDARRELFGPAAPQVVGGKLKTPKKLIGLEESYESWGDLYYGRFFEFGTVKMPARPFLGPALAENIGPATEAMKKRLAARLKKAGAL